MVPLRGSAFLARFFGTLRNGANSTMAGYSKPQPITNKYTILHVLQPITDKYTVLQTCFNQSQTSHPTRAHW